MVFDPNRFYFTYIYTNFIKALVYYFNLLINLEVFILIFLISSGEILCYSKHMMFALMIFDHERLVKFKFPFIYNKFTQHRVI